MFARYALLWPLAASLVAAQDGPVDPSTIKDCTYFVTAQQGDTCASIASNWGITGAQFLQYNPSVKSDCSGLKIGNSYCVEENYGKPPTTTTTTSKTTTTTAKPSPTQSGLEADCQQYYFVKSGDTCQGIVDAYGTFTLADFYKWNPAVKNDCSGLQANVYVCVGVPGTPTSKSTTSKATTTTNGPQPQQTGITKDCNSWYLVQSGDGCQAIVDKYGTFTLQQFYSWNPAVGSSCQSLQAGYYVCVGITGMTTTTKKTTTTTTDPAPTPHQTGIASNCTKYYKAVSGDDCGKIVDKFGTFTLQQFVSWNPAVQSDCSKLFADYYYCVAVPGTPTTTSKKTTTTSTTTKGPQPQQTGIVSNCSKYYLVADGDNCGSISSAKGISLSQFFSWNTGIKSDCSNLYKGYYVCIGVS